ASVTVDGFTHASSVIPVVRCSDAASGTDTNDDVPLNDNADPNFPDPDHVAPLIVPLLPFPEESPTVVPDPSPNEYAATRPDDAACVAVVKVFGYGPWFPAASTALTR